MLMSLLVVLLLVGVPSLLVIAVRAAMGWNRSGVGARREWAWVQATWVVCALVGGALAWLLAGHLSLGRGTMLAPAVMGAFVVIGVGLGETVVRPRRPSGRRSASLAVRRVADYLPRALVGAVGGVVTLHLATLALTTVTASADDMGRAGRQVAAWCGNMGSAASPYPGSFYSVPLVLLLLLMSLGTVAALTAVVRRPRGFATREVGDDELRRRSATRVLAAAGGAVAASHAGIAYFAGSALLRLGCQRAWMEPVGWLLLASVPGAVLLLGWFSSRIVLPGGVAAAPAPGPAGVR